MKKELRENTKKINHCHFCNKDNLNLEDVDPDLKVLIKLY